MSDKNGISRRELIKTSTMGLATTTMCSPILLNLLDRDKRMKVQISQHVPFESIGSIRLRLKSRRAWANI
jgi:hypothetical protein